MKNIILLFVLAFGLFTTTFAQENCIACPPQICACDGKKNLITLVDECPDKTTNNCNNEESCSYYADIYGRKLVKANCKKVPLFDHDLDDEIMYEGKKENTQTVNPITEQIKQQPILLPPYPNPVNNGQVVVTMNVGSVSYTQLSVINQMGQQVALIQEGNFVPDTYTFTVDVSHLSKGLYIVQLVQEGHKTLFEKIIVE